MNTLDIVGRLQAAENTEIFAHLILLGGLISIRKKALSVGELEDLLNGRQCREILAVIGIRSQLSELMKYVLPGHDDIAGLAKARKKDLLFLEKQIRNKIAREIYPLYRSYEDMKREENEKKNK